MSTTTEYDEALRLDVGTMRDVMAADFEQFIPLGEMREVKGSRHIYIDRGASVLGVAHLDTVRPYSGFWMNKNFICCPTIDNRMGAWLVLYGLPALGIKCDVLLTENEERCSSTASDFVPGKEYNWGFSFDRMGDDVVAYEYTDSKMREMLLSYGLDLTWGSYSDISDLDIAAKCFNFGCGMHDYHTDYSHVNVRELTTQVKRFANFYSDYAATRLPHVKEDWDYLDGFVSRFDRSYEYEWDGSKEGFGDKQWLDYRRTGQVYSYPVSTWQGINRYLAKQAVETPVLWFDGEATSFDWRYNHAIANVNDTEMDDDLLEMYVGGVLDECVECENVYARGDVDNYGGGIGKLCKACFREAAIDDASWLP